MPRFTNIGKTCVKQQSFTPAVEVVLSVSGSVASDASFTLHVSIDGRGLFDASLCFPGLYYIGDFIGQCTCVYLHNAI